MHTCKHDFGYCKDCKVVYCTKCDKEWVERIFTNRDGCESPTLHPVRDEIGDDIHAFDCGDDLRDSNICGDGITVTDHSVACCGD